jgi:hypothetical protein
MIAACAIVHGATRLVSADSDFNEILKHEKVAPQSIPMGDTIFTMPSEDPPGSNTNTP